MFTKIMTLLSLIATLGGAPIQEHSVYMRGMEIVNLNYETDTWIVKHNDFSIWHLERTHSKWGNWVEVK